MSCVFSINLSIFEVNNDHLVMVPLTSYLNMVLLFMAYCDSDKTFSRTKITRYLAFVDFSGAVLSQLTPNCLQSRNFVGCSIMLPFEILLLLLERLAHNLNMNFLKLTQDSIRDTLRANVPEKIPFHYKSEVNVFAQNSFRDTLRGNVLVPGIFRDVFRDNVFYHGLTLMISLILVTVIFPSSLQMSLLFNAVVKNTLFRGVFYTLDGIVIYAVNVLCQKDNEKRRNMFWDV